MFGSRSRKNGSEGSRETSGNILREFLYGRVVSSDFFARNGFAILVIVALSLVYISSKYTCQTKMEQVRRLDKELEVIKAECVSERSRYMSKVRETAMQQLVDTLGLDLAVQEAPPYYVR